MVLTVDVGNTNIVVGVYDRDRLRFISRLASDQNRTADETAVLLQSVLSIHDINIHSIDGAIISSVVPLITEPLATAVRLLTDRKPLIVGPGMKTGINIGIDYRCRHGNRDNPYCNFREKYDSRRSDFTGCQNLSERFDRKGCAASAGQH